MTSKIHWMTEEKHKTYTSYNKTLCGRIADGGSFNQVSDSDIKDYERKLKQIENGTLRMGAGFTIHNPADDVDCKTCRKRMS